MDRKKRSLTTRHYLAEGSPARIHEDELGDLTGDVYRSGRGIVPADQDRQSANPRDAPT